MDFVNSAPVSRDRFAMYLLILAFVAMWFAGPEPASADPMPKPSAAPRLPFETLGWRVDLSGAYGYAPSYGAEVVLLPASGFALGGGAEFVMENWIPLRAELGVFSIGASAWDSTLFQYRAFWGYRLAALTGLRFRLGGGELNVFLGGAVSASKYSGLSAVTSYASIAGELRWLVPVELPFVNSNEVNAILGLPLEYMFRGTARTLSLGLDVGFGIRLKKGGAK